MPSLNKSQCDTRVKRRPLLCCFRSSVYLLANCCSLNIRLLSSVSFFFARASSVSSKVQAEWLSTWTFLSIGAPRQALSMHSLRYCTWELWLVPQITDLVPIDCHSASGRNVSIRTAVIARHRLLLQIDSSVDCSDVARSRLVIPSAMLANIKCSRERPLSIIYKIFGLKWQLHIRV